MNGLLMEAGMLWAEDSFISSCFTLCMDVWFMDLLPSPSSFLSTKTNELTLALTPIVTSPEERLISVAPTITCDCDLRHNGPAPFASARQQRVSL